MKRIKKIAIIIVVLLLIVVVYMIIPGSKADNTALVSYGNINKGTIINDNNVDVLFMEKDIPDNLMSEEIIREKKELIGKKIINDLSKNTIITNSFLSDIDYKIDTMSNPVTMGLRVADISEMVCGSIKKGDYIDISVLNNNSGECIDVGRNIYVSACYNNDGTEITDEDNVVTYINVIVEKEEEQYINRMMTRGSVRICRVEG